MSRRTPKDHAQQTSPATRAVVNAIRRLVLDMTNGDEWQVRGARLVDGIVEKFGAIAFQAIGFASRPPAGQGEAIVASVESSADHPVAIAMRDAATRRAVEAVIGALAPDETMVFNSQVAIVLRSDGIARVLDATSAGTPKRLAFADDLITLRNHVATLFVGGSGSAVVPCPAVSAGTEKLRSE